jgi:hypothetical protein
VASEEDPRAAARRIVEEVLAGREAGAAADGTDAADGSESDLAPAGAPRVGELVDDAVEDLTAGPAAEVAEPDVSEARARARALVAEVLADHEARAGGRPGGTTRVDAADEPMAATASDASATVGGSPADGAPSRDDAPVAEPEPDAVPETTARLRARELVAAVLAETEAREAAETAAAEERARAEAEAAEARAREERAARELAAAVAAEEARAAAEEEERIRAAREAEGRAAREAAERDARERAARERRDREAAEAAERDLWADADRDVASETVPMPRHDGPPPAPEETTPLSVAELAAAARRDEDAAGTGATDAAADQPARIELERTTALSAADPDPHPDATAALPIEEEAAGDGPGDPQATAALPVVHESDADGDLDDAERPAAPRAAEEGPADTTQALWPAPTGAVAAPSPPEPGSWTSRRPPERRPGATDARTTSTDDGPGPAAPDASATAGGEGRSGSTVAPVLEAVVELDDVGDPPRTGRWLLASVLGAITLAILFPLAINALLNLVSLS